MDEKIKKEMVRLALNYHKNIPRETFMDMPLSRILSYMHPYDRSEYKKKLEFLNT